MSIMHAWRMLNCCVPWNTQRIQVRATLALPADDLGELFVKLRFGLKENGIIFIKVGGAPHPNGFLPDAAALHIVLCLYILLRWIFLYH
jgi:hypothetical protein